ncbi:hypothetical protein C8255_14865 [filamentous cyanobacterium CCP3]|nr:hypothetical protein C8255_14865 [filamentous cyanobacterium CCP3]
MAKKNTITHVKKAFKHQFDAMVPLILSEWPQLTEENLLDTAGDLERAVDYISDEIGSTKTRIRRHLDELASLIEPTSTDSTSGANGKAAALVSKIQDAVPDNVGQFIEDNLPATNSTSENGISAKISSALEETVPATVDQLLNDLESRTERLIAELKAEMLPELEKKARSNLGTSLLIALGLGFILGLRLGGKRD